MIPDIQVAFDMDLELTEYRLNNCVHTISSLVRELSALLRG